MNTAAIILARGGSKGIAGKNLTRIGDHSLLGWAIESCRRATFVQYILVSTDDGGIAKEAETYGVDVLWRPDALATDTARGVEALHHAVCSLPPKYDTVVDVECTTFPPYARNIDATIRALEDFDADSAMTVQEDVKFFWKERRDGYAYPINQFSPRNRQEAEQEYRLTGECFALRRAIFERIGECPVGRVVLVKVDQDQIDIDDQFDLDVARMLHGRLYG